MSNVINKARALVPNRPLNLGEALRIAELQANRMLAEIGIAKPAVPETAITTLPRIRVDRLSPIPVSGSTHWARGRWIIILNAAEPFLRQRFSLAHELKHVLDAPFGERIYPETLGMTSAERIEQIADYFAACFLMPRMWVKRAWREGPQDLKTMAIRFGVSQMAMRVRLMAIGLLEPQPRCQVAAMRK